MKLSVNPDSVQEIVDLLYAEFGFHIVIGVELEFYLLRESSIFEVTRFVNRFGWIVSEEDSELQFEIKTSPSSFVRNLIENLCILKSELIFSLSSGILFDARPFPDRAGSAMHINISAEDNNGVNMYEYGNGKANDIMYFSIGGLCESMNRNMIFFAPKEESYLRFENADIHTPTTISWGRNNRSAAIRIPVKGETRIEHRVSCADADPIEAVYAVLCGIFKGLKKRIIPPQQVFGIAFDPVYNHLSLPLTISESQFANKCE